MKVICSQCHTEEVERDITYLMRLLPVVCFNCKKKRVKKYNETRRK